MRRQRATPPTDTSTPELEISSDKPKRVPGRPFKKGQSGNPSGRPKRACNVEELARQYSEEAITALAAALKDPRYRVAAAVALLDRGYGKPRQSHEINHHLTAGDASDAELLAIALSGSRVVVTSEDEPDEPDEPPDGVVH